MALADMGREKASFRVMAFVRWRLLLALSSQRGMNCELLVADGQI